MPLHLLGKKSWNVYNPANIARVKRDEAEAQARAESEEKRQQEFEAERRLAILRGEAPPSPPPPASALTTDPSSGSRTHQKREHDDDPTARFREGERRKRKRFGEDDTDFEMRVARERTDAAAATNTVARLHSSSKKSDAPIVDSRGHISLFPQDNPSGDAPGDQKNEEAEREAAKKRREFEDQYTMRFSNAAGRDGVGVTGSGPWYASTGAMDSHEPAETQTPGKDVWGNEDPKRKARDAARVVSNDPLAMMKRGAAKARDVERERRAVNEEKAKELKELRREERRRERRRRHHDVDELEGFSLDARPEDGGDRKRERGHREHRSGSRDRDRRDKHRHRRRSDHEDQSERHHRRHGDDRHEGHSKRRSEDGERHSTGHGRRQLAKTDHY
ncbi:hypothetical protein F5Y01DRAFT_107031 [Xylaria sp. FL0043]|nr:hypothetical protein F5Y01DRAFT_107031 [Xylaria sp. FL0043]